MHNSIAQRALTEFDGVGFRICKKGAEDAGALKKPLLLSQLGKVRCSFQRKVDEAEAAAASFPSPSSTVAPACATQVSGSSWPGP